jgi:topoisomerase-4 subunit A
MPNPPQDSDDQLSLNLDGSEAPAQETAGQETDAPITPDAAAEGDSAEGAAEAAPEVHHPFVPMAASGATPRRLNHVGEMYGNWFMDYASYVILERAVPHINDGLKPVQRRILHVMKLMDDGRFDKVANIAGQASGYHPHGEMAIVDAIVGLGQKQLVIDTQGNWGNIFTGDNAAAQRYIEARLSKFSNDVLFNAKITEWQLSYDGRKKEPVTLPVKFPLVLAHGVEGIAVGLACKILPHNFVELIDGVIECLKGRTPVLLPDFPTGGMMDASEYNDGARGGKVRVRARIEETSKKNILSIKALPFGVTTSSLTDSILAANEKGKIKIARIEDLTAEHVEILVHLPPGTEAADIVNALYVFTSCEVSISVNACVISEEKPIFTNVTYLLQYAADHTKDILKRELEITLGELEEKWHFSSLEKIFIEKRIYRDIEECTTWEAVMLAIWKGLKPYLKGLRRDVTDDDVTRLTEIRIKRISKFNSFEADEHLAALEKEIGETKDHLENLTKYTIAYFKDLKTKYGKNRGRKTEITSFSRVAAAEAAVATEMLYVDWKEGFIGYGMKRTGEPFVKCSRLDDIIVFLDDGSVKVSKVTEKAFFGTPMHVALFNKDQQPVYTLVYRDGKQGRVYVKRFQIGGVTRDTAYDLTKGTKGSKVLYFAMHDTEEASAAQELTVFLNPAPRLKSLELPLKMSDIATKGRSAIGLTVTDHSVKRVSKAK